MYYTDENTVCSSHKIENNRVNWKLSFLIITGKKGKGFNRMLDMSLPFYEPHFLHLYNRNIDLSFLKEW